MLVVLVNAASSLLAVCFLPRVSSYFFPLFLVRSVLAMAVKVGVDSAVLSHLLDRVTCCCCVVTVPIIVYVVCCSCFCSFYSCLLLLSSSHHDHLLPFLIDVNHLTNSLVLLGLLLRLILLSLSLTMAVGAAVLWVLSIVGAIVVTVASPSSQ